jgi:regulator of protease activity HflC (stomatin/prohibitin superfamily)
MTSTVLTAAGPVVGLGPVGLVLVIAAALIAVTAVRVALPGERLVVLRAGRVVRSTSRPLSVIVPVLEQTRRWPTGPVEVPVLARSTTRDGVEVRVTASCLVELTAPARGATYVDPLPVIGDLLEGELVAAVAVRDVDGLIQPAFGLAATLALVEIRLGRVISVEVDAVEAILAPPGGPLP